jgi:hypothetical protein
LLIFLLCCVHSALVESTSSSLHFSYNVSIIYRST